MATTDPIDSKAVSTAPRLAIEPAWKDPETGALYVHQDLVNVQEPWAEEQHVAPARADERFGDVESWADYVRRFGRPEAAPFLTWNSQGLRAVIDYHGERGGGNRCQWTASYPFERSIPWKAWMQLANGQPVGQRHAIEQLEDLGADIVDPPTADLMNLLRNLRASVNATAQAELRPDGTTSVAFQQDKTVKGAAGGQVDLPPEFTIAIPVLKGHTDENGRRPVLYRLAVRLRVSVDDHAHLALRFTIPNAERALEDVFGDRVQSAREILGDGLSVLRAAG